MIGGLAIPKQERLLRKHPHIIVGTPGRIWYFMEQKRLGAACLHHVRFVIGDEADKLVSDSNDEVTSYSNELYLMNEM